MTAPRLCLLAKCEETHNHQQSGGTNQQKLFGTNPSHGVPLSPCTEGLGIMPIFYCFTISLIVQASSFDGQIRAMPEGMHFSVDA
jgi:hypothetical protein